MAAVDIALWIATGFLAAVYLMAGTMKLVAPAKAQESGPVLAAVPQVQLRLIGAAEITGVVAMVVLPLLDELLPVAALAAVGLAMVQVLAVPRHINMKDTKMLPMNILLFLAAMFVALGRFGFF